MCQISVVVERDGDQETIMDNVTRLDVGEDGVVLSSFFEEPKTLVGMSISRIDFLGGKVFLAQGSGASHQ